jgi:hypothetical protein
LYNASQRAPGALGAWSSVAIIACIMFPGIETRIWTKFNLGSRTYSSTMTCSCTRERWFRWFSTSKSPTKWCVSATCCSFLNFRHRPLIRLRVDAHHYEHLFVKLSNLLSFMETLYVIFKDKSYFKDYLYNFNKLTFYYKK